MITWIVETCVNEETEDGLLQAIQDQGHILSTVRYLPYQGIQWNDIQQLDGPVIFFGSIQGCQYIQKKTAFYPGTFANFSNFECLGYYPELGDVLLNKDYVMMPFGDIGRRIDWILDTIADNGCIFIRPNTCDKSFNGQVVDASNWGNESKYISRNDIPNNDLVVIASPHNIQREWRIFVDANTVITGSQYKEKGQLKLIPELPFGVVDFAQQIIDTGFKPEPIWAVDICEVDDELKVLEISSASCCGLYSSDVNKFVAAVSRAAEAEWQDACG